MTSIKKSYTELLSLTQLFLLREYSLAENKTVDPATLTFFQRKMSSYSVNPSQTSPAKLVLSTPPTQMPARATKIPPLPNPQPPEPHPQSLLPIKSEPIPPPLPPVTQPEPSFSSLPQSPLIQDKLSKTNRHFKEFVLESLATPTPACDHREFWKLFSNLFPETMLFESIPSDAFAQKLKNTWLNDHVIPPVIILSFHDEEKHLTFLKNLAHAISLRLAPARVLSASKLEKEKGWENVLKSPTLRLVIASDYGLYLQPGLMHFYREVPQQGKHFLNHIPLLLLSDLSFYLKDPQLKSLLWRAICNEFVASQPYSSTL